MILTFALGATGTMIGTPSGRAGDWPQILGTNRDGQAISEAPLAAQWSTTPPQIQWRLPAASGYAGPAIVDGIVYLLDRSGGSERLTAVSLDTGKTTWRTGWAATYRSSMDPDSGPRCVPTISQGKVVCYGAAGDLVCIDANSGKLLWQRALRKEYRADDGYFGAGSSPLVVDQTIIVNVGGKDAGIVGVDLSTGKSKWTSTDYDASYSSPVAVPVGGTTAALVVTRLRTVLLNAETGTLMSEVDFGARGPTVNAATPIPIAEQRYLLTASYGVGTKVLSVANGKLTESFKDRNLLSSQYNTPVRLGDRIVGVHGREDMGQCLVKILDADSYKELSDYSLPGPAHVLAVGQQALLLSTDGLLQLARIEKDRFIADGKYQLPRDEARGAIYRALPAFSQHVLVARATHDGSGGEFIAIKLP